MAELPIMPLKTDAITADTTHMTPEEFGAYCRILIAMWRHGARLKDDDSELAIIAGMSLSRWMKIAEKVRRPLTAAGGVLSQKRMTDTWMKVNVVRQKKALASEARWGPKRIAPGMHMHNHQETGCNANQIKTSKLSSFPITPRDAVEIVEEARRRRKEAQ